MKLIARIERPCAVEITLTGMDENHDDIPDVRDGLTRLQRIVLYELSNAQRETGREFIRTVMLYGRVVECIDISEEDWLGRYSTGRRLSQRTRNRP